MGARGRKRDTTGNLGSGPELIEATEKPLENKAQNENVRILPLNTYKERENSDTAKTSAELLAETPAKPAGEIWFCSHLGELMSLPDSPLIPREGIWIGRTSRESVDSSGSRSIPTAFYRLTPGLVAWVMRQRDQMADAARLGRLRFDELSAKLNAEADPKLNGALNIDPGTQRNRENDDYEWLFARDERKQKMDNLESSMRVMVDRFESAERYVKTVEKNLPAVVGRAMELFGSEAVTNALPIQGRMPVELEDIPF